MKAIVKLSAGAGNIAYTDFADPEVRPGQVLVEVRAAGLCGTDLSLYNWVESMVQEFRPSPPLVMGHEFAGVVQEVGAGVTRFRAGDRVTANPIMYCGRCVYCQAGRHSICQDRPQIGLQLHGCFARYVAIREENVYPVPPEVPYETASLSEVFCVSLHALDRVPVTPGDTVAVVGAGPMGFLMLLAARAAGASRIIMTGLGADRPRLEVAESLGARTVAVDQHEPATVVRDLTSGLGADIVFECAGHPDGLPQALALVGKGGTIGVLGQGAAASSFNTAVLSYREISIVGIRSYDPRAWQRSYAMLAGGAALLERLISHRLPMQEVAAGIELMRSRRALKVILTPEWS